MFYYEKGHLSQLPARGYSRNGELYMVSSGIADVAKPGVPD